ncbi:histidine phosphatase family protein [Massilia oculi]|uniref:Histidine phosphatase family protein n=1 Tax=Massilia hydrophila TaxID=3044279 RepID=A0ABS7Y8F7_9BURK|nr:phosphoglycerate mutase family protein [Massilia oculi]MCA1855968.1 histidine phosphatase family protein [Massilia oculi]
MKLPARLFRCLSLSLAMLAPCAAFAEPSAIYLVRHGEKATVGQDPELTTLGQKRAQVIAAILGRTGITSIHSTPTQRTRQTAQPLAQRLGIEVQLYDPGAPKALVEKVKTLSGPVLVVGHSNTLPELVRLFGGAPGGDIGDDEYDRLYQLTPGADGAVRTVLLSSPMLP